jgi:hypothetical protein
MTLRRIILWACLSLAAVANPLWGQLSIFRPKSGVPAFAQSSETILAEVLAGTGLETNAWSAWLENDLKAWPCAVEQADYGAWVYNNSVNGYRLRLRVPAGISPELFRLVIQHPGAGAATNSQCVKIVPSLESSFYILHLTDGQLLDYAATAANGQNGSYGSAQEIHWSATAFNLINPRFLLNTGDVAENGDTDEDAKYGYFLTAIGKYDFPVLLTRGNNDRGSFAKWKGWFGQPTFCIALGSFYVAVNDTRGNESLVWFQSEYAASFSNPNIRFRLMGQHYNDNADGRNPYFFTPPAGQYPDLMLVGHNHAWQVRQSSPYYIFSTGAALDRSQAAVFEFTRTTEGWACSNLAAHGSANVVLPFGDWGLPAAVTNTFSAPNDASQQTNTASITNRINYDFWDGRVRFLMRKSSLGYQVAGGVKLAEYDYAGGSNTAVVVRANLRRNSRTLVSVSPADGGEPGAALVPTGAVWKYFDQTNNLGTAWRAPGYDDHGWSNGPAQLGFGDGDEATVITSNRQITTCFRRTFLATPGSFTNLTLRLLRDDGGIVYLNGVEVFRSNMPMGPVDYLTLATNALPGDETTVFYAAPVAPALLVAGENLLAVEIHQASAASSDLSFALELVGLSPPQTTLLAVSNHRGASDVNYTSARLNGEITALNGDPAEVTIFWGASDGGSTAGSWANCAALGRLGACGFSALVTNLVPGTTYHYRCHASNALRQSWSPSSTNFSTPRPLPLTLISAGAIWRYFDQTNDLGTAWRGNTFSDAAWSNGSARLGFGNDGEVTKVASNRQWTTYFRREFHLPNPALLASLAARLTRDDGAVIYLNGVEVWRDGNLPSALITNQTPALSALAGTDETNWVSLNLQPSALNLLTAGWNLLAAEVHQSSLASSDVGFDFELTGTVFILNQPPPCLSMSGPSLALTWPADAGFFTLYSATNLISPLWQPVIDSAMISNNQWRVTPSAVTNRQRYFRLQY